LIFFVLFNLIFSFSILHCLFKCNIFRGWPILDILDISYNIGIWFRHLVSLGTHIKDAFKVHDILKSRWLYYIMHDYILLIIFMKLHKSYVRVETPNINDGSRSIFDIWSLTYDLWQALLIYNLPLAYTIPIRIVNLNIDLEQDLELYNHYLNWITIVLKIPKLNLVYEVEFWNPNVRV